MAKQFKQWLDDFVNNGANPADVTDWPENAGGGSGEPAEVEELPEVGEEGKVYKTEDGSLYNYVTESVVVCDLRAGESYKLVENIKQQTLQRIANQMSNNLYFDSDKPYPVLHTANLKDGYAFVYELDAEHRAYYLVYSEGGLVPLQLVGFETNPDIEFTEYFVQQVNDNMGSLDTIAPLFQNSTHQEQVSSWKALLNITPLVMVKNGGKVVVDFSKGSYSFGDGSYTNQISNGNFYIGEDYDFFQNFGVILIINEARTQIVAHLGIGWDYQSLSNEIVIYDGSSIPDNINLTDEIDYAWPTVEFTVDDFDGMAVFEPYNNLSITN